MLRRIRCAVTRHEWVVKEYDVKRNGAFIAIECDRCLTRAGVMEP